MAQKITVSVVVATYNWPEALQRTLESLERQRVRPNEIVVADDGSAEPTRCVVEAFAKQSSVPVRHVWHEDLGFRLATIRNKAVAAATGAYILQIDGDVLCPPDFVADHMAVARPGRQVNGGRVMLGPDLSADLLSGRTSTVHWWNADVRNRLNALRLPLLSPLFAGVHATRTRGCNMAFWHADFVRINGYNEQMTGWGYEDNEMSVRMCRVGVQPMALKFRGAVYHLNHAVSSRAAAEVNHRIWQQTLASGATRCEEGIDKYMHRDE